MSTLLGELERCLARSQWNQAKRVAQALLLLPEGTLTARELGQLYYGYGRACTWLQEYYASARLLEKAVVHALQARDWDSLGFARCNLGVSLLAVGDLPAANEAFATYYLDMSRYKEAKACEGHVRYNNALALRRQHRHGEAIVAYQLALNIFVEKGRTREAADCHQNIAWLFLLDRKTEEALPHLECAQSYVDALPPDYRVQMLVSWAYYHYVRGEVGEAVELALDVMTTTQVGVVAHHRSEAAWVAGQAALMVMRYGLAKRLALKSQQEAIAAGEPELMSQACKLLAEVERIRRDYGQAAT